MSFFQFWLVSVNEVGGEPESFGLSLAGFHRRNVRIVRLEVRANNTSAQKLYLSLGYSVTQRLPKYYSNGGDGLLMVKSLGT